jgi:hypothetical protein
MATTEPCPRCGCRFDKLSWECPECHEPRYKLEANIGLPVIAPIVHGLPVARPVIVDRRTNESMPHQEYLRRKRAAGKPRRSATEREDLKCRIVGWAHLRLEATGEVPTCREISDQFGCHWTTAAKALKAAGLAQSRGRRRRYKNPGHGLQN